MEETQAEAPVAAANVDMNGAKRPLEDGTEQEPKRIKVIQENGASNDSNDTQTDTAEAPIPEAEAPAEDKGDAVKKAPENAKVDARDLPKGTAPVKAE